jgi:hypothetical protein
LSITSKWNCLSFLGELGVAAVSLFGVRQASAGLGVQTKATKR